MTHQKPSRGRLRTTITVDRPPTYGSRGETWIVEVWDSPKYLENKCSVQARLQSINIPRVWCDDAGEWIGPYSQLIPGLTVPAEEPYVLNSLGAARIKARQLGTVLSGQWDPKLPEVSPDLSSFGSK